jgi:hypothetical protein
MKIDQRVRHATASKHELRGAAARMPGAWHCLQGCLAVPTRSVQRYRSWTGHRLGGNNPGVLFTPMKAYAYSMAGCKSAKRLVRIDARGYADSPSKTPHCVQALLDSGNQAGERA